LNICAHSIVVGFVAPPECL